jgi:desulfoferrodoxin (superoxide reductase-like protein)
MNTSRFYGIIIAGIAVVFLAVAPALANKSGIRIEVPETVEQGKTLEIVLHVSHSGNNFMHYTQWVELKINGEVVEKWEYSATSKPPEETFVLTYIYPAAQDLEIEARASCNLHGSRNTDIKRVSVISAD